MVDHDRRNALVGMTLLPLIAGAAATTPAFSQDGQPANRPKSLVAFFTRTGNTRVVANQIRHAISSDIVEIVPARPYPEDYQQIVDQARRETEERLSWKSSCPPGFLVTDDGVEDCEHFAHGCDDGDDLRLSGSEEAIAESLEGGVVADGDEGCHEQRRAHGAASAADAASAPPSAGLAGEGGEPGE
jgi:hypothetical protein